MYWVHLKESDNIIIKDSKKKGQIGLAASSFY